MEARQIINDAALEPEQLRIIFTAFDLAWSEMALRHPLPAPQQAASRKRLATMMLSLVDASTHDAVALKEETLKALRLK